MHHKVTVIARSLVTESVGLAYVPDVARVYGPGATDALLAAYRAGELELRPESGMGRLSAADAALCPAGWDGCPLSWARGVG